jgi:hypothetical protein
MRAPDHSLAMPVYAMPFLARLAAGAARLAGRA